MCFCFSFGLVLFGLVGLLLGHGCGKIFCLSVRKISVKPQNKRITKLPFSKRRRYLAGCWLLYFSEKNNRPNHQCLGLRTEIKRFFNQTNKDTQDLKKGKPLLLSLLKTLSLEVLTTGSGRDNLLRRDPRSKSFLLTLDLEGVSDHSLKIFYR